MMMPFYHKMFEFELAADTGTSVNISEDGKIKFTPAVYIQRYSNTWEILSNPVIQKQVKKIVEFGCSEMHLYTRLKRLEGIEHIMQVDVDEYTLETNRFRVQPLVADHFVERMKPLLTQVYVGSIDSSVECLQNTDAVIAIEVIEHLYPDVLINVPYNIFGFMKPKIVLISTPNQEYNVLFGDLVGGVRNFDHKFEWNREEFNAWCLNICERFPNYMVNIFGIGKPPPDRLDIGHVTQYAIFLRKDVINQPLVESIDPIPGENKPEIQYKLMYDNIIPARYDKRTEDEKILDAATEFIRYYAHVESDNFTEENFYKIPLAMVLDTVSKYTSSMSDVIRILEQHSYIVEDESVIVPVARQYRYGGYWLQDQLGDYSDEDGGEEDERQLEWGESFDRELNAINEPYQEENWDEPNENDMPHQIPLIEQE